MRQDLAIPEECLRDHIADLGKTGSGKTSSLKTIVEWLVLRDEGIRICVLDPFKSDWWGITSSRDGKRAGMPFQILGGPHGHVPMRSDQGALIGELVGTGKLPLSIVDMADFEPGGLSRFFNEFAPALLKHVKGVVFLVLEEAHEFAPKERAGIGNENLSVHWAKKLATAGRSKGVRLMVATQRTQALHNAVLGSCETLLAHRLTAPADQKPVQDWLKANAEKDTAREIGGALSQLKTGTAWVVSAGMNFAEKVTFPPIVTFDNSATPDTNDDRVQVRTAPVDRAALADLLRISAEEIDNTDPDKLRARIKELEGQIATGPVVVEQDTTAIEHAADFAGYKRGKIEGYAAGVAELAPMLDPIFDLAGDLRSALTKFDGDRDRILQWVERAGKSQPQNITQIITGTAMPVSLGVAPVKVEGGRVRDLRTEDPKRPEGQPRAAQKVIDALAELESMQVRQAAREMVGFLSGYSNIESRGFKEAVVWMYEALWIEYPEPGMLRLTAKGRSMAKPPPRRSAAQIQARIVEMLGGATGKVLGYLLKAHPHEVSRPRLGEESGYTNIESRGFKDALSKLKSLSFIEYPSPGMVKAAPVLFLGAR